MNAVRTFAGVDALVQRQISLVPVAIEVHLVVLEPALGNLLDGLVLAREHARGERVVGDEADAELAQAREQLALDLAC